MSKDKPNNPAFSTLQAMVDYCTNSGNDATIKGEFAILRVRWKHSKIWFYVNGWYVKQTVAQAIHSYIWHKG